ncbi:MAG: tyrosine-type recombinase/integrase [Hyphomonadaceae bacterium]
MPLKIDRRPSGIYRIRGTHHGVSVDRSAQTRVREQAEALREKWERDIFQEVILGRKRTESFAELAADYLKAGHSLGPKAEEIIISLADKKAGDVVPADVDALAAMIYPTAQPSTINRNIIAPISAIMNWAARSDRAPKRVWSRLRERSKRTDWRRPAEIEQILASLQGPHARALAALHVGCGLRASEAVFLDGREVAPDLSSALILGTVRKEDAGAKVKGYMGTKGLRDRRVTIPPRARMFIAPVINTGSGRALKNSRGHPWSDRNAMNKTLPRACERAGLTPLRAHALRHTWATWHNAVLGDPIRLMADGGWTDLSLVERYAHASDDALRDEVIRAGWAISGQRHEGTEKISNNKNWLSH